MFTTEQHMELVPIQPMQKHLFSILERALHLKLGISGDLTPCNL